MNLIKAWGICNARVYTHTHTQTPLKHIQRAYIYVYIYAYTHTNEHLQSNIPPLTPRYMLQALLSRRNVHTHTFPCIHTYIHIYIHTFRAISPPFSRVICCKPSSVDATFPNRKQAASITRVCDMFCLTTCTYVCLCVCVYGCVL